jgi:hypothetical protein
MKKIENGQKSVATSAYNVDETIGDFIKKHITDDEDRVCLNYYYMDYLNEEDKEVFEVLTGYTDGDNITCEFDKNGNVVVYGSEHNYYTCYDYDYPVADIYKELITKMSEHIEQWMISLKEQYVENYVLCESCMFENKDLRIWKTNDISTYYALLYFAEDYGIEIKEGVDYYRGRFVDIISINE